MSKSSPRWFIAIVTIISILSACASVDAENSGGYSDSSLSGTFVFRASGSSLFTSPNELTSAPVYLASVGLITFDDHGLLRGSVANSATRTEVIPAGKYITPYSSQILCNAKMSGTYAIEHDGTGTMTINFTPTNTAATCGASTGAFKPSDTVAGPGRIRVVGPDDGGSLEGRIQFLRRAGRVDEAGWRRIECQEALRFGRRQSEPRYLEAERIS